MSARVDELRRYAVKSMEGERLGETAVGPAGIAGDRAWALRALADGRPLSAKKHAALMLCRARFVDEPRAGEPPPPAAVELPDGTGTRTDAPGAAALLTRFLGVECAFGREDDGAGHFDARPLHLLTDSTLRAMAAVSGVPFPVERFRPNVLVSGTVEGRPEDSWLGGVVRIGAVDVDILKHTKRCVMTTLPQPALSAEPGVLKAILAAGGCLGVYGRAASSGVWRVGDRCATIGVE